MEFQSLFMQSKGQPIIYKGKELKMIDRIDLPSNNAVLKLSILSTNSEYKQGIILATKGRFIINQQNIAKKIILWEDTMRKEVEFSVKSKDKLLIVYNAWRREDGGTDYWHNGASMHVIENEYCKIYNCNDGFPDDDFDDLIFKIEVPDKST